MLPMKHNVLMNKSTASKCVASARVTEGRVNFVWPLHASVKACNICCLYFYNEKTFFPIQISYIDNFSIKYAFFYIGITIRVFFMAFDNSCPLIFNQSGWRPPHLVTLDSDFLCP